MTSIRLDKELEEFRNVMEVPSTFEDGFTWTALVGAIFIALLMVPGAIYMGLLAGAGIGGAAQWVTVILFIEVARRAHKHLKRPEIFVLFYMAGAAMGQPFGGLLWHQFYVQSKGAAGYGITEYMTEVWWYAPTDPDVLATRSFFNWHWYPVLGMIVFHLLMGRFTGAVLSYGLFRVASDIEKLPFPMAPIGVQGIMALAEQQMEESSGGSDEAPGWRWRVFSIGGSWAWRSGRSTLRCLRYRRPCWARPSNCCLFHSWTGQARPRSSCLPSRPGCRWISATSSWAWSCRFSRCWAASSG